MLLKKKVSEGGGAYKVHTIIITRKIALCLEDPGKARGCSKNTPVVHDRQLSPVKCSNTNILKEKL